MRYWIGGTLLVAFSLVAGAPSRADECECAHSEFDADRSMGVVWRGAQSLTLADVAAICAPALWFSSDEPSILMDEGKGVPNAHPCDKPSERGVVYYQPRIIRLRQASAPLSEPIEGAPDLFAKVYSLALRYYFYYDYDRGMDSHRHDVELAEFQIAIETSRDGCHQVRILRIEAFAHGVDWYNNILDITSSVGVDVRLPLRLLVEEAKHATCPDRNGDGIYTPGYDVNVHINDAWGVRDVLGSGVLLGSSYNTSMSKPREPALLVMPPERSDICKTPTAHYESRLSGKRYELRPGSQLVRCEGVEDEDFLAELMEKHGLGKDYKPDQYEDTSFKRFAEPISKPRSILGSVNYRYDGLAYSGVSFLFYGFDGGEFWFVPKVNIQHRGFSFEGLLTRSASRWMDGYLTVGAERLDAKTTEIDGEEVTWQEAAWDGAVEVGIKFRFRTPDKLKPFVLWYDFGGIRLGVRNNGLDTLENLRFVYEIGGGVW